MAPKEKARQGSGPIPNSVVYHDAKESNASPLNLQVSRLIRLYAVDVSMAEAIAPLVFLEVMR
jgi:hypothetical protein